MTPGYVECMGLMSDLRAARAKCTRVKQAGDYMATGIDDECR